MGGSGAVNTRKGRVISVRSTRGPNFIQHSLASLMELCDRARQCPGILQDMCEIPCRHVIRMTHL